MTDNRNEVTPDVRNKDGFGNTVHTDNWKYTPTKDGAQITIRDKAYGNVTINVSKQEMESMIKEHCHKKEFDLAKEKALERELGNDKRWYGKSM